MKQYLFSYGTLQPGLAPPGIAGLARRLHPVGRGYIRGYLYDLGRYPGAVVQENGSEILSRLAGVSEAGSRRRNPERSRRIWGQLLELPDDPGLLRRLDNYEGFDPNHPEQGEYVRKKCTVVLTTGEKKKAWIYAYNRPPASAPLIPNGDFAKWLKHEGVK